MKQRIAAVVILLMFAVGSSASPLRVYAQNVAERTYVVQPGDTLTTIAADVGLPSWQALYEANRDRIRNPHMLQVGQVLVIPDHVAESAGHHVVGYIPMMAAAASPADVVPATPVSPPVDNTDVAQPQPAPVADQPAAPVRLTIPAIDLDAVPTPVGLDRANAPIVPKHDVGWYTHSAAPGHNENVVFWGHVSRWRDTPNIPAPFARLKELTLGAQITVDTADGTTHRYVVTRMVEVRPNEVQYIMPTGTEQLTLVSCIGDRVILDGVRTRERRLIVIATPAAQ